MLLAACMLKKLMSLKGLFGTLTEGHLNKKCNEGKGYVYGDRRRKFSSLDVEVILRSTWSITGSWEIQPGSSSVWNRL